MSEQRVGDEAGHSPAAPVRVRVGLAGRIRRLIGLHHRYPWLLPLVSFIAGWIGFALVKRGEAFARLIALLALLGWVWLLVEPWIRQRLERRRPKMGNFVVNFVSQSLQQELLFFSLPFLIGATQRDLGQIAFTAIVALAALVTTVDPLYERFVARRAARRLLFHAYCSWLSALIVLPMVLLLPVERALPLSVVAVTVWLVLTLPLSVRSLRHIITRVVWVIGVLALPYALWQIRAQVPAAGLAVTSARITQTIDGLNPGEAVHELTRADLERGVVAFAAIRAPAGLSQKVIFEWHHDGEHERMAATIHGGNADGYRIFSRKQLFPADAAGVWIVDVLTPQEQLLRRLRFTVDE